MCFPIPGTQVLSCQLLGLLLAVAPPMPQRAAAVVVVAVARRPTLPVFLLPWSAPEPAEPADPAMMPWPPPLPLMPPLAPPDEGEPPCQISRQHQRREPGT